eukprot:TRINITY_DN114089_c0_g1_i1.p1 TRINITY_DN114089_c0_g1~~TRINITY_DN114089_c0_g1_i1.p1  ORF type:complete len:432 (-),score=98.29 TRINITY_DN114089_c0_g1_i1:288-1583(-)
MFRPQQLAVTSSYSMLKQQQPLRVQQILRGAVPEHAEAHGAVGFTGGPTQAAVGAAAALGGCRAALKGSARSLQPVGRRLCVAPTATTSAGASKSEPVALEVWSFNLRTEFQDKNDGPNGWSKRRLAVAEFIRKRRPAIICTQEATEAMLAYLCQELGSDEYAWRGTSREPGKQDETAGFLFDLRRLELLDCSCSWLAPAEVPHGKPAWDAQFPRTVESAIFKLKGASGALLRVLNTHMDHKGIDARKQSSRMLAEMVSSFAEKEPSFAQVLCGDFNSAKTSDAYAELTGKASERGTSRDATAAPLVDAVRAAAAAEESRSSQVAAAAKMSQMSTIHKWKGIDFAEEKGDGTVDLTTEDLTFDSRHIDWLLWRDGTGGKDRAVTTLQPVKYEVITDRLPNGRYPSDHYPVSVIFWVHTQSAGTSEKPRSRL